MMCLGHKWLQSTWRRGEMLLALVWSHAPPFNISFWALALAVLISLCFYLLLEGGEDWKPPRTLAAGCRETPISPGLAAAQSIDRRCSCPVSMFHNQNKFSNVPKWFETVGSVGQAQVTCTYWETASS